MLSSGELEPSSPAPALGRAPAILARGVSMRVGGEQLFDGLDCALTPGEIVLLRGENGSGKTTLLHVLSGHLAPDYGDLLYSGASSSQRFRFPAPPWTMWGGFSGSFVPERLAALGVGRSWQHSRPFGSLTVLDNLRVARPDQRGERFMPALMQGLRVRAEEREAAAGAHAALLRFGLADTWDRSAARLSVGQSKRLEILRAVTAGARVLLLDEPLNGLDEAGASAVLGLVSDLARERGVAVLIVEHALHVRRLLPIVDQVWTLRDGRLRVDDREQARAGLRSTPAVTAAWLESISGGGAVRCHPLERGARVWTCSRGSGAPALRLAGLRVRRGACEVGGIEGVSLALAPGDVGVLEAPNGWGKTTLVDALVGEVSYVAGGVELGGKSLAGERWKQARRGLRVLRADRALFDSLTVDEALHLGRSADDAILARLRDRRIGTLSGGERKWVAWRVASRPGGAVVILDEPFAHLDAGRVAEMRSQIAADRDRAWLILLPREEELQSSTPTAPLHL